MDLQERQSHAFREDGAAAHEGECSRHHPQGYPAQPYRVDQVKEVVVWQALRPHDDDAAGVRAVQRLPQGREVGLTSRNVHLSGQDVGVGRVPHHPAQPRPVFLVSDHQDRRPAEAAAVDPAQDAFVEEPQGPGAEEGEGGGEHRLPEAEATLGVDRRPQAHQPRPAERGPDEPPGLRRTGALSYRRNAVKSTIQAATSNGARFKAGSDPPPQTQAANASPTNSASPSANNNTRTLAKRRNNLKPKSLFEMSLNVRTEAPVRGSIPPQQSGFRRINPPKPAPVSISARQLLAFAEILKC